MLYKQHTVVYMNVFKVATWYRIIKGLQHLDNWHLVSKQYQTCRYLKKLHSPAAGSERAPKHRPFGKLKKHSQNQIQRTHRKKKKKNMKQNKTHDFGAQTEPWCFEKKHLLKKQKLHIKADRQVNHAAPGGRQVTRNCQEMLVVCLEAHDVTMFHGTPALGVAPGPG